MKEIILIQPKAGTFDMLGARLPLGLLSIAAIPFQKGYHVTIIDQRVDNNWQQSLTVALGKNPICVGITCMTGKQILHALDAAAIVRKHSNAPLVWGGVHTTLMPEQSIENPLVDIIVLREGDITFMELVEALESNKPLNAIKGLYYKQDGEVIKNPDRDFIKNLDELPELPFDLVDVNNYASLNIEGKSLDFVTSRGCPFKCSFCYNSYFNKCTWRAFSAKETVKRLKHFVNKYQVKTIYFQDDNFFTDLKRIKEILRGIVDEKLDINWGTLGLRVDMAMRIDDELFQLMEASGCINVDIGAESGSNRILEMIDKQITVEDMLEVNRRIAQYNIIVKYTFIVGFPTETRQEMLSTVRTAIQLVKENKKAYTPTFAFTPYPGTSMYAFSIQNGFVPPKKLEEWGYFGIDSWYFNFKSWLSSKQVRELKSIEVSSLFSNKISTYKMNKPLTRLLFSLYHPIAKFRFKNHFHAFPLDSMLFRKIFIDKL